MPRARGVHRAPDTWRPAQQTRAYTHTRLCVCVCVCVRARAYVYIYLYHIYLYLSIHLHLSITRPALERLDVAREEADACADPQHRPLHAPLKDVRERQVR
jgi:hypothetical protein